MLEPTSLLLVADRVIAKGTESVPVSSLRPVLGMAAVANLLQWHHYPSARLLPL